ncbi:MAG: CHAT domain-containing protein [bacterium]|nr:CHAT domain-containing protein [bacterium]
MNKIEPGNTIERELSGAETHTFQFTLSDDQYVQAAAEQLGVDVVIELFDPTGAPLAECDSPSGSHGVKRVSAVAKIAGDYSLPVRSTEENAPAGRYRLRIDPPRHATAIDRKRVAAERIFAQGETLRIKRRKASHREALKKYEQALTTWRETSDPERQADALHRLGWVSYDLGNYDKAIEAYTRALLLFQEQGNRYWEAWTLLRMALLHHRRGAMAQALEASKAALPVFVEMGIPLSEAAVHNTMGNALGALGEVRQALDAYEQARSRAQDAGAVDEEGRALHGKGDALMYQGKLQDALDALHEAYKMFEGIGFKKDMAATLNRLGTAYYRLDRNQDALDHLNRALALREETGEENGKAVTLNSLGTVQLKLGSKEQAIERYREALDLFKKLGNAHGEGVVLTNIGRYYYDIGDPTNALSWHTKALQQFELTNSPRDEVPNLFGIARAHDALNDFSSADETLKTVLDRVEYLRSETDSQDLRTAYFATKQHYYGLHVDVLMKLHEQDETAGYDVRALQIHERRRARGLLELLSEAQADLRHRVDPTLLAQERSIQEKLNATEQSLMARRSEEGKKAQVSELEKEQRRLLEELDTIRTEMISTNPQYAALTRPQPLTLSEIQRQVLDPATRLLVYSLDEKRSFLWYIPHQGPTISRVLPCRAKIEKVARNTYHYWTQSASEAQKAGTHWSASLSDMLLRPIAENLGDKRLVVVAHGALQYIPFAALPDPTTFDAPAKADNDDDDACEDVGKPRVDLTADPTPLLVNHEMIHLPSASVLATLRRDLGDRGVAPKRIAVIADPVFSSDDPRCLAEDESDESTATRAIGDVDDGQGTSPAPIESSELRRSARDMGIHGFDRLPYTRDEAEVIRNQLPASLYLVAHDFDANRDVVLSGELKRYRVVHFATHGLLNEVHPELSGLVLSLVDEAGRSRDGFLMAHEIYNLDLLAELVVLSGCQTGLGEDVQGEGLVGLTRGFMYAGAPRVVVSLWNVSDRATSELMQRFYQHVFGVTDEPEGTLLPSAALRAAQLSMLEDQNRRAPFYWAGFILQGEWRGRSCFSNIPTGSPPGSEPADLADSDLATLREHRSSQERYGIISPDRLLKGEVDPTKISSSGWGVLFGPDVCSGIKDQLRPLLELRREQAGQLYKEFTYSPGTNKNAFLSGYGVSTGPVEPNKVPYYLFIVGDPKAIPYRFQYELDVQYAVGRIHFDDPADYGRYASSVVAVETGKRQRTRRRVTFFGVEQEFDPTTLRVSEALVKPLIKNLANQDGDEHFHPDRWSHHHLLAEDATKSNLRDLLHSDEIPALLFTACHGVKFSSGSEKQIRHQGALVCQEWPGPSPEKKTVDAKYYFRVTTSTMKHNFMD